MPTRLDEAWVTFLVALTIWREARGSTRDEIVAVACSIRNRVRSPGWWGKTYAEVVTCPGQYSSMPWLNKKTGSVVADANGCVFPQPGHSDFEIFAVCCAIAANLMGNITTDTVAGATHYFDFSLDAHPPAWTKAPTSRHVKDVGSFRFWLAP